MNQINITSVTRISLILVTLWLSACGGSGDSSTPPPLDSTEKSSTWGEMKWGKGTWSK